MLRLSFLFVVFIALFSRNSFAQEDAVNAGADAAPADASAPHDEGVPSKLLDGVINFDFSEVDAALDAGESINLVNVNDWSAARFAVAGGDLDMLKHLIEREIDLNIADNLGQTPLMIAAAQCDKEMVQLLLDHNASPLLSDKDGLSAYDYAINAGRKFLALLIAEESTLYAIANGDIDAVLKSVIDQGAYVNIRNDVGYNPLIFATRENNLEAVQKLIGHGADTDRVENDGWSPLHFAADFGNVEIVKALRDAGADYTLRTTKDNKTARDYAEGKDPALLELLPVNTEEEL